jgi:hypothetical protein
LQANQSPFISMSIYQKNIQDWSATSTFVVGDIIELAGTVTKLENNAITVRINQVTLFFQLKAHVTSISFSLSLQIKPFKCHVSQKSTTDVTPARTWLRAIGVIKSLSQIRNNTTIFPIQATQYISGTASTLRLAEFDITIRHDANKKNFHERTKKAKIGSKVSIVGELDIHNNKLYVELHNFDFLSFNTSPQTTSTNQTSHDHPTSTTLSEKRSLMYKSLFDDPKTTTPPKRNRTSDTASPTPSTSETSTKQQDTDSVSTIESDDRDLPKTIKQENPIKPQKRQLRSKESNKIASLASAKLNLSPHDEDEL